MPTTRSQKTEEKTMRVYEETPASPSAQASASASSRVTVPSRAPNNPNPRTPALPVPLSDPTATAAAAAEAAAAPVEDREPRSRAASVRSQRSSASAIARIRQAEYEAQERLAVIRRKELQLEAEMVKKKLAMEVATIHEETDRESVIAREDMEAEHRVSDWLLRSQPREELPPTTPYEMSSATRAPALLDIRGERVGRELERPGNKDTRPRVRLEEETRTYQPLNVSRVADDTPRRPRSPTPARSKERGIDRLAEALEKMAQKRPPPRQAQELPIFNGAPHEWLLFKASMVDSTRMYGFTQAENLARLRNCLKGDAKETVAALLYTASDPAIIMQTLEQYYGRPEIIIDKALEDIRRLPRPGTTAAELNTFAIRLQNIVSVLTCIDDRGYLQNPMLARYVTEKLSPHVRARWCDYAEEYGSRTEPDIVTLSRFLMREADRAVRFAYSTSVVTGKEAARPAAPAKTAGATRYQSERKRGPAAYATNEQGSKEKARICMCCGEEHDAASCEKLIKMPVSERWNWAREARVCFRCLNSRHRRANCTAKQCGQGECRAAHHRLLHEADQTTNAPSTTAPRGEKEDSAVTASAHAVAEVGEVLLKVCPVTIRGPGGKKVDTHALLDEGSTITLLDHEIAEEIEAQGPKRPLSVHGITATPRESESQCVDIEIRGKRTGFHSIRARTITYLNIRSQTIRASCLGHAHLKQLRRSDVCYEDAKPRMIIGADNWHLIVSRKLLTGQKNEPAASLTQLGWVVHGTVPRTIETGRSETVLHVSTPERCRRDSELSELVSRHFAIDALGIGQETRPIPDDERAKEIFKKTARLVDGHYEVGLPWRTDRPQLPPSYDMAFRRLKTIERKMDKSPEFKRAYTTQIANLIEKGYAAKASRPDDKSGDTTEWYLPHFAVSNPHKPGKVRLVFDAAATTNGKCLNDELLAGPDMLHSLYGVLFRFREKPIAITADIKEMFLRIRIRPPDRNAQRFLWRGDDRTTPPQKYEMASMIFGAKSSPFLAHSVRDENAERRRDSHPQAYLSITKSHYMDDWVESFDDEGVAARAIKEVTQVHGEAGFELAGWNANCGGLLADIVEPDKARTPKELGANAHPYGRTLGLMWRPDTDDLAFNTVMPRVPDSVKNGQRTPTKRETLAAVMSIFDPLGLLSPYTIAAKIMLQELWRKTTGWDEPLPPEEAATFAEWVNDLRYIRELRLPRRYVTERINKQALHVFVDASEQAYAAAAYWRFETNAGNVATILVAGKAKVAPMKAQSIPRLELQACLIGARLAEQVTREHRHETKDVTYWSDSKTALHWIRNDTAKYTPFVAHRLREIGELTRPEQWRWVPTAHNVADDATRTNRTRLGKDDRWYQGPAFLREIKEAWPTEAPASNTSELVMHTTTAEALIDMTRFSSYERLIRTATYVMIFVDKCRRRDTSMGLRYKQAAEVWLVKEAQRESFAPEIERLSKGRQVDRGSRLYKLDPTYEDGVIRLNGRINAANVPTERKRPPILDGRHTLARLILQQEHKTNHHVGREQIVNNVRERYWILRVRPATRAIIKNCVVCRRKRTPPAIPVKGDLPAERLDVYSRPFTRSGVDCFGPMTVTVGRRREKRWGMLFTCLVTRAVHIELIASLNIDSAVMALRRMAARRGWPRTIMSDNGTNFHGADVELTRAYAEWQPELKEYAINRNMEWRYIDPGAPNQGGAWERMIRTVKAALTTVLKERAPCDEVLATLMTEVEHTVNARPLTHVSVSHEDPGALTPNHFLMGTATGLPTTGPCNTGDKKAWRAAQGLADKFWSRWLKEYLPLLTPRGDTRDSRRQIGEGDLVVIADGQLPRNVWPMGRVERVIAGPDGVTRSAEVRTRGGIFRRPVRRLVVLTEREEAQELRRGEAVADNKSAAPNQSENKV